MKPRLCLITSVVESLAVLLRGQPRFLAEHFDVTLLTSPSPGVQRLQEQEGVAVETFTFPRQITPHTDLATLARLTAYLRRLGPTIVQTYTPKAGLLGMMAARLAGVPHRIHGIVGMPLMEAHGARRALLTATERATYRGASHLLCNSMGLRDWVRTHLTRRAVTVIGHGSINGVDANHWSVQGRREASRAKLGAHEHDLVFLFVGRLVRDKGLVELVDAFAEVAANEPRARLLLVGDEEPELDPLPDTTRRVMEGHPNISRLPFQSDVRPWLECADVFVLPSYREGLPNALLEAGAMGLPCIATDINGCNEIIERDVTGILVQPKSAHALARAFKRLLSDSSLRHRMGDAGRSSVVGRYDQKSFWNQLLSFYGEVVSGNR